MYDETDARAWRTLNETDVDWSHWGGPRGRFDAAGKEMSVELGAREEDHPFEVELTRVPPGAYNCPQHAHMGQWEYYIIISGTGVTIRDDQERPIGPGDHFMQAPGTAHHIHNTGSEDLVYYCIANDPDVDIIHYPNSDKWFLRPPGKLGRMTEADYFDGEE